MCIRDSPLAGSDPVHASAFSSCPTAGLAMAVTISAARKGSIMIITTMGPATAAIFFTGAALRSRFDCVVCKSQVELERVQHGLDLVHLLADAPQGPTLALHPPAGDEVLGDGAEPEQAL